MTDRTVRDKYGTAAKWLASDYGIDPDAALDRDCPTCEGRKTIDTSVHVPHVVSVRSAAICPDCKGTGRIEVNRVMVVPVEVADWQKLAEQAMEVVRDSWPGITNSDYKDVSVVHEAARQVLANYDRICRAKVLASAETSRNERALRIGRAVLASDLLEIAWALIANASQGDWSREPESWRVAAESWRDAFHEVLPLLTAGEVEG
jgi:hypothetical protein